MARKNNLALFIILGLVGMCVVCGGGFALLGGGLFRTVSEGNEQAKESLMSHMTTVSSEWSLDDFKSVYLASAFPETDAELQDFLDKNADLGAFKSMDGRFQGFNDQTSNGKTRRSRDWVGTMEFENGRQDAEVTMSNHGDGWKISKLFLGPIGSRDAAEARADLNSDDEAMAAIESHLATLSSDWKLSTFKTVADKRGFTESDEQLAAGLEGWSSFGEFVSMQGDMSDSGTVDSGEPVKEWNGQIEFQNTTADATIEVLLNNDAGWLITRLRLAPQG